MHRDCRMHPNRTDLEEELKQNQKVQVLSHKHLLILHKIAVYLRHTKGTFVIFIVN